MSVLIGVYRKYITGPVKSHPRAKRYLHAYFLDDNGKIHTERVSTFKAFILKLQIHKRISVYCARCGAKFHKLVKKREQKVECPVCGELG